MHPSRRRKKRPNCGLRTVEVLRGAHGFGFTISGQQPCILSCIVSGSPAALAGLRAGDFLISVNGLSVARTAHDAVVARIGASPAVRLTLAERYYSDSSEEELARRPRARPRRPRPGPLEHQALVGYLGTVETPDARPTVGACVRKLRQERRAPAAVLMTLLPACLTLKDAANRILAIYPAGRVVHAAAAAGRESRYFGLVTSGGERKPNNAEGVEEMSNSCHVFMVDPKIVDHSVHATKAESFKITCTPDLTGSCLEFPRSALHIVNLVQDTYKLHFTQDLSPVVANSPQPSASSNSDSGIGFRDDCGNVSDRILVVEFPAQRAPPELELNNIRCKNGVDIKPNRNAKQLDNLNNIRACGSVNIRNVLEKSENLLLVKQNNEPEAASHRLTCRALLNRPPVSPTSSSEDVDNEVFSERPIDVDFDNISMHSTTSMELQAKCLFKTPIIPPFGRKVKLKKQIANSCEQLDRFDENIMKYKLSPKVYGLTKPNYSCEELNGLDSMDKYGYGSLQELCTWNEPRGIKSSAQSEPDVRIHQRIDSECEENGKNENGAASWALSFEKLLDDPLGLHTFAEFLKKEFSAENIYFWAACERYRKLAAIQDRLAEAQRIHQQHLAVGAPEGVNVDAHGRQCTEQRLAAAEERLFDPAQKQIFNLMKFDSYPRFLKSPLYKRCLAGEVERPPQLDAALLLQPAGAYAKLKKSLSNAEDRSRKSLLPWNRKNRSKSKDRGETEYSQRECEGNASCEHMNGKMGGSDVHSSKSSLTSLDLGLCLNQDSLRGSQDECRTPLCRVLLNNGSTTVVQIKEVETIEQLIRRLLDKRGIHYSVFEVITDKHPKAMNLNDPSNKLAGCEVKVEQRVGFRLDLPNRRSISVRCKYTKNIVDVLRPILSKHDYKLECMNVTIGENECVDINLPVFAIDGKRLKIEVSSSSISETSKSVPGNPIIKIHSLKGNKLDEITNQVFDGILQEKVDGTFLKPKSDKGSVKSEDYGSEHSSIFDRLLRRDSGFNDRKKKAASKKSDENLSTASNPEHCSKRPLIAKWKTGVRLQMTGSESDELVENLTRVQSRSRLEDQRGTEINSELPDFLKTSKPSDGNSHFYVDNKTCGNYENRNIGCSIGSNNNNLSNNKTPTKVRPVNGLSSNIRVEGIGDPPPLPPKPKIVPIKPLNWGQHGVFKKDMPASSTSLYLEQPSSSFV